MFYNQSAEGASSGEHLGQITLPQFRGIMTTAKVVTSRFPPERMDEIFTTVATSPQTLARKVDNKSGVSTFDLLDFMIGVIHVAYHRHEAEGGMDDMLSAKLYLLITETFNKTYLPELSKKLARFEPATQNPAAALLLKRGRK